MIDRGMTKCGMGYWASDYGYICSLEIEEVLCTDIEQCPFRKEGEREYYEDRQKITGFKWFLLVLIAMGIFFWLILGCVK